MARLMKLEVLTPEKILVKREDISYVLLNTVTGGVGVLANHGPMIAVLGEGTLKLQDKDNHVILVYVEGGFAEVKDNQVVILTPRAQRAEKIDVAKYQQIRDEALARLDHPDALTDVEHTEKILRRAEARLRTAALVGKVEPYPLATHKPEKVHCSRQRGIRCGLISKMAASKMGQLRLELVELNERLEAATDEEQIRKLRKTIQEKEVYYNILADRLRTHTRNF